MKYIVKRTEVADRARIEFPMILGDVQRHHHREPWPDGTGPRGGRYHATGPILADHIEIDLMRQVAVITSRRRATRSRR